MYAAHLLWALAQPLLLHNWIAGFSFLVVIIPHFLLRIGDEEKMMLDNFGDEYSEYMKKTGRFLPKRF
jgi:protein-S-isoprenylcysteine O-methyltransferase Ste14